METNDKVFFKVLKHPKGSKEGVEPELFIVEKAELFHFLHEQDSTKCVLVFDEIPLRNLYLLSNDAD